MPTAALPQANVRASDGQFPQDEFVTIPNVPVFAEHVTTSTKGRPLRYTRVELAAIAERCNRRIQETGDYAALTIGHTPDAQETAAGKPMPDLVGFAGPFRLGTVGQGPKQRYAILADFHVFKDEVDRVRKNPRRSPEVWLEDRYEDQFLDPIALLGAEAPRLDMGLLYARNRQGKLVEKYSASPGMGSVFLPTDDINKRYQAQPGPTQRSASMLQPEDLQQIVAALEQQDWVQFVKSQMQAGQAPGASVPDAPGGAVPGAVPDAPSPAVPEEPDRNARLYSAGSPTPEPSSVEGTETVPEGSPAKYSRLAAENAQLKRRLDAFENQLAQEKALRVDAERYSALTEKRQFFAFDLDKEVERTRYSKMNDKAFEEHLTVIDENYQPIPIGLNPPTDGTVQRTTAKQPERYSREVSDKAMRHCEAAALRGEEPDYAQVLEQVAAGKL